MVANKQLCLFVKSLLKSAQNLKLFLRLTIGCFIKYTTVYTHRDACQNSNIQCPIVKGQRYTYHGTFPVLEAYPKVGHVYVCVCMCSMGFYFCKYNLQLQGREVGLSATSQMLLYLSIVHSFAFNCYLFMSLMLSLILSPSLCLCLCLSL